MLEFAFRHNIPIVPVGSNGCEAIYPGGSPFASGGEVEYRIGKPLTLDDDLCRVEEAYTVYPRLEEVQGAVPKGAEILTNAINELLDEPYQLGKNTDERSRAERFM